MASLLSSEREDRPISLLPRMLSPSLSHSVGIVTLTYEDRGIRFLCGPYCLLFRLFASRATFAARFYDACVYLAISRCNNIVDLSETRNIRTSGICQMFDENSESKNMLMRYFLPILLSFYIFFFIINPAVDSSQIS